jgi:hypothetical protein
MEVATGDFDLAPWGGCSATVRGDFEGLRQFTPGKETT